MSRRRSYCKDTATWITHSVSSGVITVVENSCFCLTYYVDSVSGGGAETGSGTEDDPWTNLNTVFNSRCLWDICYHLDCPAVKVLVKGTIDYPMYQPVCYSAVGFQGKLIVEPWDEDRITVDVYLEDTDTAFWCPTGAVLKNFDLYVASASGYTIGFRGGSRCVFDSCTSNAGHYDVWLSAFNECEAAASSGAGAAFNSCDFSTFKSCVGTSDLAATSDYSRAFYACEHGNYDSCTGTADSTVSARSCGFEICDFSTFHACSGYGTGGTTGFGFFDCDTSTFSGGCYGDGAVTSTSGCRYGFGFYGNNNCDFGDSTTSTPVCVDCGSPCPYTGDI